MADPKPPATLPTTSNPISVSLSGCLKALAEIAAGIVAVTILPLVILGIIVHWAWPWYSSKSLYGHSFDNALIALASVAGVLWSGAIIAYSIHKRYTPPLRTGVQLLNFAILAPLAGLVGDGAALRTVFYIASWFFIVDTAFSMTNLEMLRAGKFSVKIPPLKPDETPDETTRRQKLAEIQDVSVAFFQRVAHGTRYFAIVSVLCITIFLTASPVMIAWSCFAVLVISLFLMLPEIFNLSEPSATPKDDSKSS